MGRAHDTARTGRVTSRFLLALALSLGLCSPAPGGKEPSSDPSYKEATILVPIQTEGTTLDVQTDPIQFRSIRMRFRSLSGEKQRIRLILQIANVGEKNYTASVQATLLDDAGEPIVHQNGRTDVDAGEPEMLDLFMTIPKDAFERADACRLKLAAWRD